MGVVSLIFGIVLTFFTQGALAKPLKVGLVLDKGGRDDKSFNAAAFKGATEAKEKYGIDLKVVTASDDAAIEPSLRTFARRGYDLVVGIGFVQGNAVEKVAKEFPKTQFLLVDSKVNLPNVRSVLFNEHEGSFLVGAVAALTTKNNVVGFIGGMDIPLIRRFEVGYRAGVQHINPKVEVITNYVGSTSDAWKNPMKGKELALSQYKKKADILFAAAGASALGSFDAAEELNKFIIGCDSNQNWIKPGRVLTSMLKRVDLAVFETIKSKVDGNFEAGQFDLGLKEGAVDFALDTYNRSILTPAVEAKVNDIKKQIIDGKIKVPDYYDTLRSGAKKKNA
ncbi:MAG: BMP family ABC transporter substrate-binding protein [Bdellovibrionales bacterium]|nr:BMP family ABC transporter substrate-binding protein [Bdellovibrionales bacterium]